MVAVVSRRGRRPPGKSRQPAHTGIPAADFLFDLQDAAGVPDIELADAVGSSRRLVGEIRSGRHKRLINPFLAAVARHFGYKFALVPASFPDIVPRGGALLLPPELQASIQTETERPNHADRSRTSPPPSVRHEQDNAQGG